jgi:DNA polymerase III subunit beta
MRLICTQENFKKAIYNTERVVGKQITLPILENILLETDQGMLKISATNLEIGITLKIGAKIEQEGRITIPARLLGSFVSNLPPQDTVILETKDSTLKITSGEYQAQIKGMDAQDFPIIPDLEGDFLFSIIADELRTAAAKLLPCTSSDDTRPELTGINMLFFENEIHMAATDSFRLAEAIITIEKNKNYGAFISKNQSIIVPAQTLAEMIRIAEDDVQSVKVAIEESQIFFQVGGVKVVSRLINGKYPEYKHIIPQKFATQVLLPKEEIARALKIASVFTNSKSGEVSVIVQDKKVVIESHSAEAGENKTEIKTQISGPNQKIVFNPRYIFDGVSSVTTNSLDLFINSGSSPVVIRMVDEKTIKPVESFTYVVMPIKN